MRITDIQTYALMCPIEEMEQVPVSVPRPDTTGKLIFAGYRSLIVRIETDEGISGAGEGLVRLAPKATEQIVLELRSLLIGKDPGDVEVLWDDLFSTMENRGHNRGFMLEALSAIDMALWDINAQAAGVPLANALGGVRQSSVPCYASSIRIRNPDEVAADAASLVASGFSALKMKIGRGAHRVDEDIEAVQAVRAAIGPGVRLMVDANGGFNLADAVRVARELERCNVLWFEEPLPSLDLEHYRLLRRKVDIPIAAGETWFTRFDFLRALRMEAVDIVQPDVSRCGGFTEAKRIAWLASTFHCSYAPHTGQSSALCLLASIHLAASMPNTLYYEYVSTDWSPSTSNPLRTEIVQPALESFRNGGRVNVPSAPGLGVEIDWTEVARHRV